MGPAVILLLLCLMYSSEGQQETLSSGSGPSSGQQEVVVKPEQDVTLQCQNPRKESISVLKWSRPDLNSAGYVYFYRNKRSYETYQHPSFHGRVKLRDAHMTGGDASLILNNVTFQDAGMYECHMSSRTPQHRGDRSEISYFISLTVTASEETLNVEERYEEAGGDADGDVDHDGSSCDAMLVAVGVAGAAAAAAAAAGLMVFWTRQRQKAAEHHAAGDKQQVV